MRRTCWALVTGIIMVGAAAAQGEEPTIQGKPVSEWVKQLRSDNRGFQVRAARALSGAPADAIPSVIPHVQPLLKSERENDRFVAAQTLGEYGSAARAAVPDMLPMLEGTQFERNRAAAAKALGQILKDAPPSAEIENVTQKLIAIFRDAYPDVQREAVTACGMIGPAAKSCIPHLVAPLEYTLGKVARDSPYLLVRRASAWTLGRMGPLAAEYMDRLISRLHGEGGDAPEVPEAIGRIGPTHANVVPNLMDFLERQGRDWRHSPEAKENAWTALEQFGAHAAPVAALIGRYLREGPSREPTAVAVQWFRILRNIGPAAKPLRDQIEKFSDAKNIPGGWKDKAEDMSRAAAEALAAIDGK